MEERWYRLEELPDLTLNKYSSLEENGVGGVIEKHIAFLRQINRKGIVSDVSFHLFYLYYVPSDEEIDRSGRRLHIFFMARGSNESLKNVPAMINASPLSDFFQLNSELEESITEDMSCSIANVLLNEGYHIPTFRSCAMLTKSETFLPSESSDDEDYYMIRDWEMNEDGRLYNMCKLMETLKKTVLYRVDLYPIEKSTALRESLRRPMCILRQRQEHQGFGTKRDYDGKDTLDNYEDLIEKFDSSPHFIANIMVMAENREDAISILDAAGSESLIKGKYSIACFNSNWNPTAFLDGETEPMESIRDKTIIKKSRRGLIICKSDTADINLNFLPTLFTLEEIAPFFRFPALYDGEVIQIPKETAPTAVDKKGALFLGKDENGYDVYFPLSLLPKHAFVSGVPGSGKTNTMHHLTSSLWKEHHIPFLVLEPAKQEYRALANDPGMKEMYLFSPNADMSFPLHINPFEMPKGTLVAEHIRRLCSVFEGAFPLEPPMPFLLDTAIEAVYRETGWIPEHVYTGDEKSRDGKKSRSLPTMSMLYKRLEQELKSTKYSDEVRGNLESALKVRIGSLLRREMGDVFDVPVSTFPPEKWLEVPAVIELESMGTGPANFLTLMLCSLIRETLKINPRFDGNVRHVIFIEEAHNLIGPESEEQTGADADPKLAATAFVVKMLAEVRALKEGIIIADQLPTVMAQEVLKNTGLKIGLRITSSDDRSLLGSTMAASPLQLEQMSTFAVGEALMFYEKLMRPFTMRIKEWWGEIEDKTEKEQMISSKNDAELRMSLFSVKTYQDQNLRSIAILRRKYQMAYFSLKPQFDETGIWFNSLTNAVYKYNKFRIYLLNMEIDVQSGIATISEEKQLQKYTQLNELLEDIIKFFKCREWLLSPTVLLRQINELHATLTRLKRGRWKRFGANDTEIHKVEIIQNAMREAADKLYDNWLKLCDEYGKSTDGELRAVVSKLKIDSIVMEFLEEYRMISAE